MKFTRLVLVAACILIAACAFSGCLGSDDSANDTGSNSTFNPVTTVTVEKRGILLGTNEIIQITLPEEMTSGYFWEVVPIEGLIVEEQVITSENNFRTKVFNITAEEAGTYTFTTLYMHNNRTVPTYTFTQRLDYVDAIENPSDEPGLIMNFEGIPTPKTGSVIEVKAHANPATGYTYDVQMSENSMLRLLDVKYVKDDSAEGMLGAGGTYSWYVTSDVPGTYMFDVYESRGVEDPISLFYIDLTFV